MLTALALAVGVATGASAEGRPLRATVAGPDDAPRRVLVVGAMHGDEPAGRAVVDLLREREVPADVQLWTVRDLNPDGSLRRRRGNARGVDLNRNFPHRWRRAARGRFWPGPRPGSEPETRWAMDLVRAVRPHLTIWLHQPYGFVVRARGVPPSLLARYARVAQMPVRALPRYRGTAIGWQNARSAATDAFVVEIDGDGRQPRSELMRHVRAVERLAAG